MVRTVRMAVLSSTIVFRWIVRTVKTRFQVGFLIRFIQFYTIVYYASRLLGTMTKHKCDGCRWDATATAHGGHSKTVYFRIPVVIVREYGLRPHSWIVVEQGGVMWSGRVIRHGSCNGLFVCVPSGIVRDLGLEPKKKYSIAVVSKGRYPRSAGAEAPASSA